jgi:general secretion pathway protein G
MRSRKHSNAFTLVEILIVVVILGILAAIVLPQFSQASDDAKESAVVQDLQTMRAQIELYKFHHGGTYPADGGDAQLLWDQMCKATKYDKYTETTTVGDVGDSDFPLGPYFLQDVPSNPYNGGRGVSIVDDVPGTTPDETATATVNGSEIKVGWFFNPATGRLKANCEKNAADGTPLADL